MSVATPSELIAECDSSASEASHLNRILSNAQTWANEDAWKSFEASPMLQNACNFFEQFPFDHSLFTDVPVHIRKRAYARFQRMYRYEYFRMVRTLYRSCPTLPPLVPISQQLT